jgi:hypothetical protein
LWNSFPFPRLARWAFGARQFEDARYAKQLTHGPRFALYLLGYLHPNHLIIFGAQGFARCSARSAHIALGPVGLGQRRRPIPLAAIKIAAF